MPVTINNSKRSKSVIKITGNTAVRINLNQLSTNTTTELVSAAEISHITSSTDGKWIVYRGNDANGESVISLFGGNDIPLSQFDVSIGGANSTANLYITNSGTDGTLILTLSKTARYTIDPDTGYTIT
jgi:hypothetical protein